MKRSEMVTKIYDQLVLETEINIHQCSYIADLILKTIEDAGMPPASFFWSSCGEYENPNDGALKHISKDAEIGRFEWEPENE